MKALTICQPFASLIVNPPHVKRVENRSKATRYRGDISIHAGRGKRWLAEWLGPLPQPMPMGMVIGVVRIADCIHVDDLDSAPEWLRSHEHATGPFCWVLEDPRPVEPFAWKGSLGLWNLPDDVILPALARAAQTHVA